MDSNTVDKLTKALTGGNEHGPFTPKAVTPYTPRQLAEIRKESASSSKAATLARLTSARKEASTVVADGRLSRPTTASSSPHVIGTGRKSPSTRRYLALSIGALSYGIRRKCR